MLDLQTVDRIAELARLGLTDAERELFKDQLGRVIDYVHQIAHLDTSGVGILGGIHAGPGPVSMALRPDEVGPSLPREAVLTNAASVEAGQILVPRFLDAGTDG